MQNLARRDPLFVAGSMRTRDAEAAHWLVAEVLPVVQRRVAGMCVEDAGLTMKVQPR